MGSNPISSVGDVAQLVERMFCKHEAVGSNPIVSINLLGKKYNKCLEKCNFNKDLVMLHILIWLQGGGEGTRESDSIMMLSEL